MRQKLVGMVLVVLLGGCTATSTQTPSDQVVAATKPGLLILTPEMEQRAGVKVTAVTMRKLVNQGLFSSTIEAPQNSSGFVTAPVQGLVTRVIADVGQTVRQGQIVAYISSPALAEAQAGYLTAQAKVQEAQAQIQLVQGRMALVQADVQREATLVKKGISAVRDLQLAQAKYNGVQSELAAAQSLLSAAQSNTLAARSRLTALKVTPSRSISDELPIRSPVSGTVVERNIQPGQSVSPSVGVGGEHLFTIGALGEMWAMLEVPQSEVASLKLGALVQFTSEVAPGEIFRGRVVRLGENFDPLARTVAVRAVVANPKGILKPGMLVLAQAVVGGKDRPVLAVPTSAVQQVDGHDVVFVQTAAQQYRVQKVTLGERTSTLVEIKTGLTAGTLVVAEGSFVLKSEALKASLGGE
jgi:membrane fusion protein, heavy metal efflux system